MTQGDAVDFGDLPYDKIKWHWVVQMHMEVYNGNT